VRHTISDEKLKDKITADEKKKAEEACQQVDQWLASNQEATAEQFDAQRKELETIYNPIVTKLYGQGGMPQGGPGGFPQGGFPGGPQGGPQGGPEPNAQDID